ncbi:hypothetical protein D8M04_03820 [Oceanobacillus piezotolerans]|uniref:Uncharacterized protein n=1 Tax=Oceanobacillus piezotolerans TaxID=2448030 RepID=A0A498DIL0_9BACI|nr:hypothetical protein D8M04_03820 [Oceanobacillus piezotolerans]
MGGLTIIIHVLTFVFVFGFINREKLVLRLNGINEEGKEEPSRFILYYAIGIVALGIVGYVTLQVTLATSGSNVFVFGFLHLYILLFLCNKPCIPYQSKSCTRIGSNFSESL